MSPHFVSRLLTSAAAIAVVIGVSGCAAAPGAAPVPTSTPTPTASSPAATATPSPAPTTTTAPAFGDFSGDQLAQICVDETRSTFNPDVTFDPARTRIERRTVTPEWLVIVPARTGGLDARSLCTIGGTPTSPVIEMASGSIEELPEEQIQRLIRGENEGTNP